MIVDVHVTEEMADFGARGGPRATGLFISWPSCSELCCPMSGAKINWRKTTTISSTTCSGMSLTPQKWHKFSWEHFNKYPDGIW